MVKTRQITRVLYKKVKRTVSALISLIGLAVAPCSLIGRNTIIVN